MYPVPLFPNRAAEELQATILGDQIEMTVRKSCTRCMDASYRHNSTQMWNRRRVRFAGLLGIPLGKSALSLVTGNSHTFGNQTADPLHYIPILAGLYPQSFPS